MNHVVTVLTPTGHRQNVKCLPNQTLLQVRDPLCMRPWTGTLPNLFSDSERSMHQIQTTSRQLRSDPSSSCSRSIANVPVRWASEQCPAGNVRGSSETCRRRRDVDASAGEWQPHSRPVQTRSNDFRDSSRVLSCRCRPFWSERSLCVYADRDPWRFLVDDHVEELRVDRRPGDYAANTQGSADVENVITILICSEFWKNFRFLLFIFFFSQANVSAPLPVRQVELQPIRNAIVTPTTVVEESVPQPGPSSRIDKSLDEAMSEEQQMDVDEPNLHEKMSPASPKKLKLDTFAEASSHQPDPSDVIHVVMLFWTFILYTCYIFVVYPNVTKLILINEFIWQKLILITEFIWPK